MTKTITGKLIAVLTLCLAVIHGGSVYIDYQLSRDEILERVRLESQDTVNSVISDLEYWLDGVQGSTQLLARILAQNNFSPTKLNQLLENVLIDQDEVYGTTIALNPNFEGNPAGFAPYYYRKNGGVTYVDLATDGKKYWQEDWYTNAAAAAKPVWTEPYFDDGGGEILMTTFSVPIYHSNAQGVRSLYAVLTADVALEKLHTYLQHLRLGQSGRSALISRGGIVLSSSRREAIVKNYLEALSAPQDRAVWQRSFEAALRGETLTFPTQCPARLGQCSTRISALTSTGWPVAVFFSRDEVLSPLRSYGAKTIFIGLATLLLMALAVGLVSRRLTKPLVALASASDAMARGQLVVPLPRVKGKDEVARLVQSFGAMQRELKSYIADLEVATAGRARLEGELAAATQIQMSMLPQGGEALQETEQYSLWAKVRPAKSVGGDLYTFYQHSDEELCIVVGDVSDKGVPAALFMAKAISHIQQFEEDFQSPSKGMALLNNALEQGNDNCMFVTLFFGVINLRKLELTFASAGHTAPSLLRSGTVTEVPQETGPALGLAENMTYPENTLNLAIGDRLAIFTDGIDEAFNNNAEMFGLERFNTALQETGVDNIAQAGLTLFQRIDTFAGDMPQSDDITLMLIDLCATVDGTNTHHSFSCNTDESGGACDWLHDLLNTNSIEHSFAMELVLVTEEVLSNIQKYAQLPASANIELRVSINADGIELVFSDTGIPFDPFIDAHRASLGSEIDSAEVGGLGVHLITRLTDRQGYQRSNNKNIVSVEKFFSSFDK